MKFSVLSVILLTTICAMGIKIYQDQAQISHLHNLDVENQRSGGTFRIEDTEQFHLRRLNCEVPNTMRFRLYVPPNTETYLHSGVYYGGTDLVGYMSMEGISLLPGENIISIYSDVDFHDKEVPTLVANVQGTSQGFEVTLRLADFKVFQELDTKFNNRFRATPNSLHGFLETFRFDDAKPMKALLHLPDGIEKKTTVVQDKPVGVAIWFAPKPKTWQIDSRFKNLETIKHE